MAQPLAPPHPDPHTIMQLSDTVRRLRMVEEGLANVRRKVELSDGTYLENHKNVRADVAILYSELDEIKETILRFKDQMHKLVSELQLMASKEDLDALSKYVDMWAPVKFVTQAEVSKIVAREVRAQLGSQAIAEQKVTEVKEELKYQVTPEQKKKISAFVNEHEDVYEMIMTNPIGFKSEMAKSDFLSELFRGVNLHELSAKLKSVNVQQQKESNTEQSTISTDIELKDLMKNIKR